MSRRPFGQITRLRSGRYQARWKVDGAYHTARHTDADGYDIGPRTFATAEEAEEELTSVRREIKLGKWRPPRKRPTAATTATAPTLREYAEPWLRDRDLSPTTRDHYAQLLRDHIYPTFGDEPLTAITAPMVRAWHAKVGQGNPRARRKRDRADRPVTRAHAYGLLRTILGDAVADEHLTANPCRIKKAGRAKTTKKYKIAELDELAVIVREMPAEYQMMVQLAVWCSLRFGELAELRRKDVDLKAAVLRVRRGVVRTRGGKLVKTPKSEAGVRDVTIPSHIVDDLRAHLDEHAQPGRDGLLFPGAEGGHLAPATFYGRAPSGNKPGSGWYRARALAGRSDLRFHDLRHTGQTLAAQTGATLRELMNRAGQSSPGAALRYLHEASERQREIAEALSELAKGNVVPIGAAKSRRKGGRSTRAGSA